MKQILLVNPFSSNKYLSERFKEYGVYTTAVYTIDFAKVSSYHNPPENLFDEQIRYKSDNVDDIIEKLGHRQFDYVLCCL